MSSNHIYSNQSSSKSLTIPYTYLIGWTATGMLYYGRRTAVNCCPSDFWKTYFTSSRSVKLYIKEHGDPDVIQIRQVFNSPEDAKLRVHRCVQWENKFLKKVNAAKDPRFLNKSNGDHKFDVSGMTTVIDTLTGKTTLMKVDELRTNSTRYVGVASGKVPVIVKSTGIITKISVEEFRVNRHLYRHHAEGAIAVTVIATNKKITVSTEEFHKNRHLYQHHSEGYVVTDDAKEKIRIGNTGKPKSEVHKCRIRESLTGKPKSPEHLANLAASRKPHAAGKPVIINGDYFASISVAARFYGVRVSGFCNILAGRRPAPARFWEVQFAFPVKSLRVLE